MHATIEVFDSELAAGIQSGKIGGISPSFVSRRPILDNSADVGLYFDPNVLEPTTVLDTLRACASDTLPVNVFELRRKEVLPAAELILKVIGTAALSALLSELAKKGTNSLWGAVGNLLARIKPRRTRCLIEYTRKADGYDQQIVLSVPAQDAERFKTSAKEIIDAIRHVDAAKIPVGHRPIVATLFPKKNKWKIKSFPE